MAIGVNRFWILRAHPIGDVKPSDISLETGPIPVPTEGQVLVKNIYVSIDPTHRIWMKPVPGYMPNLEIGEHLRAVTLGEIVESKSERFKKGDYVTGMSAVEDYFTADATTLAPVFDTTNLTANLSVYALLQGFTAWAGMKVCAVQKGDTFVVSAAAGAVGSVAGQLAKARGARTIGIVGSQAKADWIINDLGFDHAINYKTENVSKRLAELAPNGINAHYENVGGAILDAVLENLADFPRIAICGMIAGYNDSITPIRNLENILLRRATMKGFICTDHMDKMEECVKELKVLVDNGQLKWKEDIQHDIENYLPTLQRLFDGSNTGKLLLKIN